MSRRPLTVLHLVANRWWTGSAEPVVRVVLALRARGHRALLALAGGDRFEVKAREAGVEPVEGLRLDVKSGPLAIVGDARRLRTLVARERVEGLAVDSASVMALIVSGGVSRVAPKKV